MGKSKRIRNDRAEIDALAKVSKKEDKNTKRTGIIIVCVIAAILLSTIALIVINKSGVIERGNIVYESENYKVNEIMFDFLFYNNYNTQYNYYASLISAEYVSYFINKDTIAKDTKESVQDYLVYCEAARKEGVTLGDFENKKIDEAIDNIKESVKSSGYALGTIYGCDGMNYSDVRDMLKIQYLANKYLSDNEERIREEITSDTERVNAYFEAHKADFINGIYISGEVDEEEWKSELETAESAEDFIKMFIDLYVGRNFSLAIDNADEDAEETEDETEATEDETTEEETETTEEETEQTEEETEETEDENEVPEVSEALLTMLKKTVADMIKVMEYDLEVEDVEDIENYKAATIKKVFDAKYANEIEDTLTDEIAAYAETAANAVKENITKALKEVDGGYKNETEIEKWFFAEATDKEEGVLFKSARAEKDVFVSDDSDYVAFVKKVPTYDNDITKNVGHILVKSSEENDEKKDKAQAILAEFKAGEQNKENFEKIAQKYTEDSGVFYYNVKTGDMVTEFNDWIFAEERKAGDTDIVKTEYGYHVMYFLGDGVEEWELTALENDNEDGMYDVDFKKWKDGLTATYKVTVNDKAIEKFDASIA